MHVLAAAAAALLVLLTGDSSASPTAINNVIVFVMDDLSPFYLDPDHPLKMPNLKQLAKQGVEFTNAHTAFPVCGPSRMAIMTGRYADVTKLHTFERFIPQVPGLTTVGKYMSTEHGMDAVGFGKVYHEDKNGAQDVISQSMRQQRHWTQNHNYGGSADDECPKNQMYCTFKQEKTTGDFKLSTRVVQYLRDRAKRKIARPVVAFVGLRKPHLEWGMPVSFANKPQSGVDDIQLSEPSSAAADGAEIPFRQSLSRFDCFDELNARRIGNTKILPLDRLINNQTARLSKIRQMYFAASHWVDTNVGRIVNYVQSTAHFMNNTAFVLVSDHGFSNGEHGLFCKNTLFDQSTRIPVVVVPAKSSGLVDSAVLGGSSSNPVSTIDLFPTVVHLATGKELANDAQVDTSGLPLSGRSMLAERGRDTTVYTFSQYPRCELVSSSQGWQCVISRKGKCDRKPNIFMGYMARTVKEKYVEWRHFKDSFTECTKPTWPGLTPMQSKKLVRMWQINVTETGAVWSLPAPQRELFNDYHTPLKWSSWEHRNALLPASGSGGNVTAEVILSLEMSAAIRWRFDDTFADRAAQPCNGHGFVKLVQPAKWTVLSPDTQPERADVKCDCVSGWTGVECEEKRALV